MSANNKSVTKKSSKGSFSPLKINSKKAPPKLKNSSSTKKGGNNSPSPSSSTKSTSSVPEGGVFRMDL
ncbi:hypothetical protein EV178_006350 [Coemansia sp. RSA 1646]|nr:hypothetical protein EV178_006350 [Coemansia sp. RSA 1646]